jgi:hypothetical protein
LLQAKKNEKKLALVILSFIFDSNSVSKALKQNLRQTNQIDMKTLIKSAIIGVALAGVAQAVPSSNVTQNATQNVTTNNTSFTFSQFNASFGTLTAVELLINSSIPAGNIAISNSSPTSPVSVDDVTTRFRLTANSTLGITAYSDAYQSLVVDPDVSTPFSISPNASQVFLIDPGQSLLSSPQTRTSSLTNFSPYIGGGSISFLTNIQNNISTTGASFNVDSTNYYSVTAMTLRYTYTPSGDPSAVPEPGQVAASLLLLGGIGGYIFIKRRRSATPAAA